MARVIIPQGTCMVSTLLPGTLRELERAFTALDDAPHVSSFLPKEALLTAAANAGLAVVSATEETIVDYYSAAESLMRSIKSIGGGNKALSRRKGLMTPQQMTRLQQAYATWFAGREGLPATWRILYMVLRKT